MAIKPEVLDALVAAGCTAEQLAAAVKADAAAQAAAEEARRAAKRANNAERQRRFKERRRGERDENGNAGNALITPGNAHPSPNDPPAKPVNVEDNLNPTPPYSPPRPLVGFGKFYDAYPRKQGRKAAEKAWAKAVRIAAPDEIMAGLERYRSTDPDPQFVPLPASWLNGERWADEVLPLRRQNLAPPPKKPSVQDVARTLEDWTYADDATNVYPLLPAARG